MSVEKMKDDGSKVWVIVQLVLKSLQAIDSLTVLLTRIWQRDSFLALISVGNNKNNDPFCGISIEV